LADNLHRKYIQTQIFDSAFGQRGGDSPLNANQPWCGRDDTTELYFASWDHLLACFAAPYIKEVIGPDGPKFADFESSIVLMALEMPPLPIKTRLAGARGNQDPTKGGNATVAMLWISTPDDQRDGTELEQIVSPVLTQALEQHAQDDCWGLVLNQGTVSERFDLNSYFGGAHMPQYALVYKIFMKDNSSVRAIRRAQAAVMESCSKQIDEHKTFITFSHEALVLDCDNKIKVGIILRSKPEKCH